MLLDDVHFQSNGLSHKASPASRAWAYLQLVTTSVLAVLEEYPDADYEGYRFAAAAFLVEVGDPAFLDALPHALRSAILIRAGEILVYLISSSPTTFVH